MESGSDLTLLKFQQRVDPLETVILCLQIENELKTICNDILDVLDKHLILAAVTGESKVFYYKM